MDYNELDGTGVELSILGLGGHEFLDDGRVKALHEDLRRAVEPGEVWEGFGGEKRRKMVEIAVEAGVNFFDLTVDSEKAAFGRNMKALSVDHPVYVQTRPEGLVYNNIPSDTEKLGLLDYETLSGEARRALKLLRRDQIDFYNFGLHPPAVHRRPGYVEELAENVDRLKADGLIRFACIDTLSSESISVEMIETGSFDAVFTNFNVVNDAAMEQVIPAAQERGLGIFCREAFMKGKLFTLAEEAGITDRSKVARAAIRWILAQGVATLLVVGVAEPEHLVQNIETVRHPELTEEDQRLLNDLKGLPAFAELKARKYASFEEGLI